MNAGGGSREIQRVLSNISPHFCCWGAGWERTTLPMYAPDWNIRTGLPVADLLANRHACQ